MVQVSINPATGETIASYDELSPEQAGPILAKVEAAWQSWKKVPFAERAVPMRKAAALLRERKHELARLMALEMGKPLAGGRGEAEKCAWVCEFYADKAEEYLTPIPVEAGGAKSFVAFNPLGPV